MRDPRGQVAKWQSGKVAKWQSGKVARLRRGFGGQAEWQSAATFLARAKSRAGRRRKGPRGDGRRLSAAVEDEETMKSGRRGDRRTSPTGSFQRAYGMA